MYSKVRCSMVSPGGGPTADAGHCSGYLLVRFKTNEMSPPMAGVPPPTAGAGESPPTAGGFNERFQ